MAESIVFSATPTTSEAPAAVVVDPNRPAWLPENFKTPEDFAASYKELQAKATKDAQAAAVTAPVIDPNETPEAKAAREAEEAKAVEKTPEEKAADEAAAAAGVKMEDLETEFSAEGKLSDASYEKLAKVGFTKEVVDEFVAYRVDAATRTLGEYMAAAGGDDQYGKLTDWAKDKYTPAQLKAYNDAMDSNDKGRTMQAIVALRADYEKVKGVVPTLVKSTTEAVTQGSVYLDMSQFLADMAKPEYKESPAFRDQVAKKLARSKV